MKAFDLNTYQKKPNSVHYTSDVVFCSDSKKQIFNGIAVLINGNKEGIYSTGSFIKNIYSITGSNESVEVCMIVSNASPLKKTIKKERGKMTTRLRYEILKRDGYKCTHCGATPNNSLLQVDHIKPVSKGGETVKSNLQVLCSSCNNGKSNAY